MNVELVELTEKVSQEQYKPVGYQVHFSQSIRVPYRLGLLILKFRHEWIKKRSRARNGL